MDRKTHRDLMGDDKSSGTTQSDRVRCFLHAIQSRGGLFVFNDVRLHEQLIFANYPAICWRVDGSLHAFNTSVDFIIPFIAEALCTSRNPRVNLKHLILHQSKCLY